MFPWESAFSGTEVDPAQGTTTEEHLQGDIAFAFKQSVPRFYFACLPATPPWLPNFCTGGRCRFLKEWIGTLDYVNVRLTLVICM
jgi:hypothetical protein